MEEKHTDMVKLTNLLNKGCHSDVSDSGEVGVRSDGEPRKSTCNCKHLGNLIPFTVSSMWYSRSNTGSSKTSAASLSLCAWSTVMI